MLEASQAGCSGGLFVKPWRYPYSSDYSQWPNVLI